MAWPAWMVRGFLKKLLRQVPEVMAEEPFTPGPESPHLALFSSCGVHLRDDPPFETSSRQGDPTYRRVPVETPVADLTVSHGHYDESGVRADPEIAFPISAVRARIEAGEVAALYPVLYSFRGYFLDLPTFIENTDECVDELVSEGVNAALLTPC